MDNNLCCNVCFTGYQIIIIKLLLCFQKWYRFFLTHMCLLFDSFCKDAFIILFELKLKCKNFSFSFVKFWSVTNWFYLGLLSKSRKKEYFCLYYRRTKTLTLHMNTFALDMKNLTILKVTNSIFFRAIYQFPVHVYCLSSTNLLHRE